MTASIEHPNPILDMWRSFLLQDVGHLPEPERVQASEIILETYHDPVVKGGRNSSRRIHFGQDLVDAFRQLHLAWEAAKEVLGQSHKFDNKGRNNPEIQRMPP